MVCLFVLIDSRHDPLKIDLDFMEWLGENGVPFVMVFTKADKLTTTERMNCIAKYQEKMKDTWRLLLLLKQNWDGWSYCLIFQS